MVRALRERFDDRFSHYFDPQRVPAVRAGELRALLGRRADRDRGQARPAGGERDPAHPRPARWDRARRPDRGRRRALDRGRVGGGLHRPDQGPARDHGRAAGDLGPGRQAPRDRARAGLGAGARGSGRAQAGRRHQGRLRSLRDLQPGRPRRAFADPQAPRSPRGRGPAARPARQRRRAVERGGPVREPLPSQGTTCGLDQQPHHGPSGLRGGRGCAARATDGRPDQPRHGLRSRDPRVGALRPPPGDDRRNTLLRQGHLPGGDPARRPAGRST